MAAAAYSRAVLLWDDARRRALVGAVLFGAAAALITSRHELWRDEMQAWLLASTSHSPAELLRNMRHEGHPALWHLMLWVISRVVDNPHAMQVLSVCVGTITAYLIIRFSPFPRISAVLLCAGYFLFYEYTVIARNYGLGVLGLVIFAVSYSGRRLRRTGMALSFVVMTQANLMSYVVAACLATLVVVEILHRTQSLKALRGVAVPLTAVASGLVLGFLEMRPDSSSANKLPTGGALSAVAPTLGHAYSPIPPMQVAFWNHVVLGFGPDLVVGIGLLLLGCYVLRGSPTLLVGFTGTTAALGLVFWVLSPGAMRQQGYLFVVLIIFLWLAAARAPMVLRAPPFKGLVAVLIATQLIATVVAVGEDWSHPFSDGAQVAAFIKRDGLGTLPILGYGDYQAETVSGLLGKPIYYPQSNADGTFIKWTRTRRQEMTRTALDAAVAKFVRGRRALVLLTIPPRKALSSSPRLKLIATFDRPAVNPDEEYWLLEHFPRQ